MLLLSEVVFFGIKIRCTNICMTHKSVVSHADRGYDSITSPPPTQLSDGPTESDLMHSASLDYF